MPRRRAKAQNTSYASCVVVVPLRASRQAGESGLERLVLQKARIFVEEGNGIGDIVDLAGIQGGDNHRDRARKPVAHI